MSMSDPIADMLTRIRNAQATEKQSVVIPASKVKQAIAQVLKDEGYIEDYAVRKADGKAMIEIGLKYYAGKPVIEKIERILEGDPGNPAALLRLAVAHSALGRDRKAEEAFARQVRAHGRPGDVLFCLSTSGRSANVLAAARAEACKQRRRQHRGRSPAAQPARVGQPAVPPLSRLRGRCA